ncbi:unnamed protein product [Durusdinium trenchii]|uniref:Chloroplastic n=2 Tax=Durusdinium trenchii TaxID=1381693 RepID=A0ABP0R026_9DINO
MSLVGRACTTGAIVLATLVWHLGQPVEYTFLLATFEDAEDSALSAAEAFRNAALPPELLRKLKGPVWTSDAKGEVVALLLDGRLEDWLRNPQYVLEDVTRRTAQMRYGTFEDVCCFGTGHLVRMAKRLQRYWNDWVARTWTANVQFSQDPNLCKSQSRLHCGRVFAGNTAWQHVVLWEADPSEPTSGLRLQPI